MKIRDYKLTGRMLFVLACQLSCWNSASNAVEPRSAIFDPADQTQVAPNVPAQRSKSVSGTPTEAVVPGSDAGLSGQGPAAAPARRIAKPAAAATFASNLPPMFRGVNHAGWDEVFLKTYRITDGRLVSSDTVEPAPGNATNSVSFSLPVSSNNAVILEEFGCQSIVQKVLKRGERYITVKALEFEESDGAVAAYDLLRKGSTTVVRRGDGSSEDGDSISFWQDKFLFVLAGTSEDDDESKEVVTKFAEHLSKIAITHAQPPAILSRLPVIDRVRGTEKIVMGPASASKYFPAPALAALSIESSRAAAVADYQILQPTRERLKLLYIDYGEARFAEEAFNNYLSQLEQLHPPEQDSPTERRVLFKLNKVYLMCLLKQPAKLIVIYGARKSRSPMFLAGQIR